jgi:hypothetical protein
MPRCVLTPFLSIVVGLTILIDPNKNMPYHFFFLFNFFLKLLIWSQDWKVGILVIHILMVKQLMLLECCDVIDLHTFSQL